MVLHYPTEIRWKAFSFPQYHSALTVEVQYNNITWIYATWYLRCLWVCARLTAHACWISKVWRLSKAGWTWCRIHTSSQSNLQGSTVREMLTLHTVEPPLTQECNTYRFCCYESTSMYNIFSSWKCG